MLYTLEELAALLEPVGVPVLLPGEVGAHPPYIAMAPAALSLAAGGRFMWRDLELSVTVPLMPYATQYADAERLTVATVTALAGTDISMDGDMRLIVDGDQEPAVLQVVIETRMAAIDLCPPPAEPAAAATPEPEPEQETTI